MALLLVLSIAVADVSKRWIEDPFRAPKTIRVPVGRARRIGVASGAAVAVVLLLTSGVTGYTVEKPQAQPCQAHRGE